MWDSLCDLSARRPSKHVNYVESHTSLNPLAEKELISSCRICLSSLFKPAALACGHRFCEKCLDQYWKIREKPACIICPLCRACAFNIDFMKTGKAPSTEDFRRTFSPIVDEVDISRAIMWCIKLGAVMPALYFLVKWLHPTFVDFSPAYT